MTDLLGLMYHDVTDDPRSSGFQRAGARPYTCSRPTFDRHLDTIAQCAVRPGLVTAVDRAASRERLFLTFDDGGRSALYAADELHRRGWAGHFFIVTERLGERTFLTPADLRYIHTLGHLVGTHSHTHPDIFSDLTPARMISEWRTSAAMLADILGTPCIVGSVPGGDISRNVLESAAAAGLEYLFTSEPTRRAALVAGCRILGRFSVKANLTAERLATLLNGRGWHRAMAVRRLKVAARRVFTPLYRLYVRRTTQPLRETERQPGPRQRWLPPRDATAAAPDRRSDREPATPPTSRR